MHDCNIKDFILIEKVNLHEQFSNFTVSPCIFQFNNVQNTNTCTYVQHYIILTC